ncbi:MarR family winged helix-turn-helix transcriptional regulator [Paenibacillus physcomitrellae]|uniref:MarR family transcriptional regulator n=1 Tax=Paenibacillus physcomitrellae TaxID=1619311 RepID=A0ABQ1G3P5_9BACL|nr:MarR family transcriptional regulator [Paenibacillus physcomitrellae]GGA36030.1 MarR family transcriptional regulator [Paenibacillus physcomitrellae]
MEVELDHYIERLQKGWTKTFKQIENDIMRHKELGLTGPQFHMLIYIYRKGPCKVSDLADALEVKPSAITVMLDRLVQNGFVERRHDKEDRRAVLVSLTECGNQAMEEGRKKSIRIVKWYLEKLELSEVESLVNIVEKLSVMDKPPWLKK